MRRWIATALMLAALPAQAQLITHRDLSYPMASAWRRRARRLQGARLCGRRGGGAGPHTMENARRKAYTARTFRMSTQQFIEEMKTRPVRREQTTLPGVIAISGGVPIKLGDDTIGGIGLSGSPGVDEECVNAGIEKVKQYLK
jgi:uncharacterized protein GlcG (DUF336 family)